MKKNSFLQLRDLEMAEFVKNRQDTVRTRVESRLRTSEFISNTLELFFPKMADTFTVMMGGEAIEGQHDYPTIDENELALKPDVRHLEGPENRGEIIR
ncbi:hypothetical protein [Neolewinella antarctica]|uniref:Uncharacterized protein n=1 Tax=Neolewinella antarctica TaxID=442734 RepID=A0ABX0XAH7_9BACT|nr:hypothetical protein [Neolewinella antarctica]NJC25971.1 hypothetical protein [Neolewinella antarctica]